MNGLPYYKAYPRDFIEGTIGMSFELKGAYRLVLDLIYMQGGRLPDDAKYISGLLGCSARAWKNYRDQLIEIGKITAENGVISNFRASLEIDNLKIIQEKQRQNGSKIKKINELTEAMAKPRLSHTEPEPEPYKELAPSAPKVSRFEDFWEAYPHRGGAKRNRKGAEGKYAAAVRRGIPEQTLIDAARRYRTDRRVIDGFARDPVTWLNQNGWEDDIEPARPERPAQQGGGQGAAMTKWEYIAKHGSSAGWAA